MDVMESRGGAPVSTHQRGSHAQSAVRICQLINLLYQKEMPIASVAKLTIQKYNFCFSQTRPPAPIQSRVWQNFVLEQASILQSMFRANEQTVKEMSEKTMKSSAIRQMCHITPSP
jgi:nitric oxide reductase large subunit